MKPIYWLSIFYVIVSVCLFSIYEIKYVNDSHRYLEYANNLSSGFYFENHNFWYLGYVLFIYLVTAIHDSYKAIILAQYIYGLLAVWYLFFTAKRLFANENVSMIATLLFILFVEVATWHSYLLAESFLTSSVCISIYFLTKIRGGGKSATLYFGCAIIVLLTGLAKPTGIALVGAIGLTLSIRWFKKTQTKSLRWLGIVVYIFTIVLLAAYILDSFNVVQHYQTGEIVYASSKQPASLTHDSMFIEVPTDLYIPYENNGAVVQVMEFTIMNPLYALELFFKKMFYFLFHIRPYWSVSHNIFSLIFLIPIYCLSIRKAVISRLKSEESLFAITYLAIHTFAVSATSVDWDGRFLMPLLPVLFLVAAPEIFSLKNLFSRIWSKSVS